MLRTLVFGLALFVPLIAVADTLSAQALLKEMAQASASRNYQGRFLYQFGSQVSTILVRHAVFDGKEYQRLTHLDGLKTEVLRRGKELICLHSNGSLTRITDVDSDLFSFRDRLVDAIPDQYRMHEDGSDRIAGRAATRIRLMPRDNYRYGYWLWLDDASHLLLKSEVVDSDGVPLERVEFVSLDLDPGLTRSDFQVPKGVSERSLQRLPAGRKELVQIHTAWLPGGFHAVDHDWRRVKPEQSSVAAQSYSDGLSTFTVFVEPAAAGQVEQAASRAGPTVALRRSLAGDGQHYFVTLVGEIPERTARRVMKGIGIRVPDSQ